MDLAGMAVSDPICWLVSEPVGAPGDVGVVVSIVTVLLVVAVLPLPSVTRTAN